MASVPVVSGTSRIPDFTKIPAFIQGSNRGEGSNSPPTLIQSVANVVYGAQLISGPGGQARFDAETIVSQGTSPGAILILPRFIQPDLLGRAMTRRYAIRNEGPEALSVVARGATIDGSANLSIPSGETAILTSIPRTVGAEVLEYAILIAG